MARPCPRSADARQPQKTSKRGSWRPKAKRKKAAEKSRSALLACSAEEPPAQVVTLCSAKRCNALLALLQPATQNLCTTVACCETDTRRSLTVLSWLRRAAGACPSVINSSQRVLLVGEGNFSFARALLRLFGGQGSGIVATAFDPEATVLEKYDVRRSPALLFV